MNTTLDQTTYSLAPFEAWFNDLVDHYRKAAPSAAKHMDNKVAHTMRVLDHVRGMRKEINAGPELGHAMEVAALLHDVGRFPQTANKALGKSVPGFNHGTEGAKILEGADILDSLSPNMRKAVIESVKLHNAPQTPIAGDPVIQTVLEAVRNSDKLDGIRNNLLYLSPDVLQGKASKTGMKWDADEVSEEVVKFALDRQLIPMNAIRWSNDFILFLCCWIYDLNFNYSFLQLKESGNFKALLDKLPDNSSVSKVKEQLLDDLNWIEAKSR